MKRLISALLVVGLIVTSLPVFAVSAFAGTEGTGTVGTTSNIEESGNTVLVEGQGEGTDLSDGAEELDVPEDELDGAPSEDGGDGKNNPSGQQGDVNAVELGNGSDVTYTEETLTVPAQYVWYYNDEYAYIIFKDEGEDVSFSQMMEARNIESVQLQFAKADRAESVKYDIYPLAVPLAGTEEENLSPHMASLEDIEKVYEKEGVLLEETSAWKPTGGAITGTLKTREVLGVSQAMDGNKYSFDVTKDITMAQMGELGTVVSENGYYGYALKSENNVNWITSDGENKPKLIVTYQKETERTPNEDDIEAADAMLEQRQMTQGTLEGSGTVEDPYLIYDADDLQGMAENDNACYI